MKKKGYQKLLSQLSPYVRPHKTVFFLSVIFAIFAIVANMAIPIFSGLAIDNMLEAGAVHFRTIYIYLVIIAILTILSSLLDWLGEYYMYILTYKTGQTIRN